ncbi:hypothetical protein Y032_0028g1722 [Ancylostoma ceylanicum]|uniref:Cell cycle control protein 50A n=2 Tax=Ancylostoma ceylanicum TaxID=53326 RepID=A0A016URY9_9BILA|nr:hypothetical protein Y032_0028g1722 [Ancylostoma ceylanicum]
MLAISGHLLSQQHLSGCHPLPTAAIVLPTTILIGFLCIALGCVLQVANSNGNAVLFRRIEYGNCSGCTCEIDFFLEQPWEGKVYFYYRLRHFYKTHRRIQRNVCREQLIGLHSSHCKHSAHVSKSHYSTISENGTVFYAPMGVNAAIMFNDVYTLKYLDLNEIVPLTTMGITSEDEERYYSYYAQLAPNQSWCDHEIFKDTAKPDRWKRHICEMGGYKNKDFIVWMRPVINSNFKKLHRILNNTGTFVNGLPAGNYRLYVENNYDLSYHQLAGKAFEMLRPSWYGGRDSFLSIVSIVVGAIYVIVGIVLTVMHLTKGSKQWP